ncbi:MAG: hypothetical protein QOE90_2347 [Thermoplasmata archaeon]|jgi:hypothetical protein|nr:hypothetical protein [Thermoplasmata archaeon]
MADALGTPPAAPIPVPSRQTQLAARFKTLPDLGAGLLPDWWGQNRQHYVTALGLAYDGSFRQEPGADWAVRVRKSADAADYFLSACRSVGLEMAPFHWDALAARIRPDDTRKQGDHIALVRALNTDYGARFSEHVQYRLLTDGNVHVEITGPTGLGKSSCAIALADWIWPIRPGELLRHVNFDMDELTDKLPRLDRGESVIQDEVLELTGEGAATARSKLNNVEDTIRKRGVNLITCSPREHDFATMQIELEALAWNRVDKWTLFLAHVAGKPTGLVPIPWCRAELWNEYEPFKAANLERSLSGAFQDRKWLTRKAMRFFGDENLVDYLDSMPKGRQFTRTDFDRAIGAFRGDAMASAQRQKVASMMFEMVMPSSAGSCCSRSTKKGSGRRRRSESYPNRLRFFVR